MATQRNTGTDSTNQDGTEKVGFLQLSVANALTALAGGGQPGATALTASINRFTTVATGGDSAILPKSKAGMIRIVKNATAATSMNVFPAVGDAINAVAVDGAYAIAGAKGVMFFCAVDGTWDTILTA